VAHYDDRLSDMRQQRQQKQRLRMAIGVTVGAACVVLAVIVIAVVYVANHRGRHQVDNPPEAEKLPLVLKRDKLNERPKFYYRFTQDNLDPFANYNKGIKLLDYWAISKEFKENELKAIKEYQGKSFYVAGFVRTISVNAQRTEVTVELWQLGYLSAYCTCSPHDKMLISLKAGEFNQPNGFRPSGVLLKGTCKNAVLFEDCSIIEISE